MRSSYLVNNKFSCNKCPSHNACVLYEIIVTCVSPHDVCMPIYVFYLEIDAFNNFNIHFKGYLNINCTNYITYACFITNIYTSDKNDV